MRPDVLPGYLSATLPSEAPELPQPFADVVADVKGKIIPGEPLPEQGSEQTKVRPNAGLSCSV